MIGCIKKIKGKLFNLKVKINLANLKIKHRIIHLTKL